MELTMAMVLAVVAGLLGVAAGWFVGRMRLSDRVVQAARTNSELSSQIEAERSRVAELQNELSAEQLLLDEVATRNRMTPRAFRETVARDYLHPADPQRRRHLSDDVIDLTESQIGDEDAAFQHRDALAAAVADRDRALDAIAASLRDLRRDIEAVVAARSGGRREDRLLASPVRAVPATESCQLKAGPKVVELRDEVADLRRRLAEGQIQADRLSRQLATSQPDAGLRRLTAELADLRARVLDLQN